MAAVGEPDFGQQRVGTRAPGRLPPAISIGTSTFSNAVSDGSRWKNWNTKPMREPRSRASASSPSVVMSTPSITMLPVEGASRPAIRPSSVDLPLPDGPVIATTRPDGIDEIEWDAGWSACRCRSARVLRDAAQLDH